MTDDDGRGDGVLTITTYGRARVYTAGARRAAIVDGTKMHFDVVLARPGRPGRCCFVVVLVYRNVCPKKKKKKTAGRIV